MQWGQHVADIFKYVFLNETQFYAVFKTRFAPSSLLDNNPTFSLVLGLIQLTDAYVQD